MSHYRALTAQLDEAEIRPAVETRLRSPLTPGEVRLTTHFSSVNYKDALAFTPRGGVVCDYPIVPGIDAVGVVCETTSDEFAVGDEVIAHGYEIGTARDGGYAEELVVPADWVVPLGTGLSMRDAAAIGTAGFTAAMSVAALVSWGIRPESGPVIVTGATGGVGSASIDLLSAAGYEVVASSGKPDAEEHLRELGASEVIGRLPLDPEATPRPLGRARWAAAIDCVGGRALADVLSSVSYGGVVAASGLTGGSALNTTVLPFILRGVGLLGIDSVQMPIAERRALWQRIGSELKPRSLARIGVDMTVADIAAVVDSLRRGDFTGRAVIDVTAGW